MEAEILLYRNILVANKAAESDELTVVTNNFCGVVLTNLDRVVEFCASNDLEGRIVYLCGNVEEVAQRVQFSKARHVFVVENLSCNYSDQAGAWSTVHSGEVPLNVHNVGILFRRMFGTSKDYFQSVVKEHQFQSLTESNKPNNALRTGIYLSEVKEEGPGLGFNLLRCSSNFAGPTDNFRNTDKEVIDKINLLSNNFFMNPAPLNHVLAQIYHNSRSDDEKQRKAKIKEHSDKTKDMPSNGMMAFVSFYENLRSLPEGVRPSASDPYDLHYKNGSILTCLRWRLKKGADRSLKDRFDIPLYPNSVFLVPLTTNRLYTHEVVPSQLPVEFLPTRMGYVIRCSSTDAISVDGNTYICRDGGAKVQLEEPTQKGVKRLKDLYYKENVSTDQVVYEGFDFSLNKGDYMTPIV